MKYIEFMQYSPNELHDKQPVLINLEQVAKIYPTGNMTCVSLAGEGEITILRNDYEEVLKRIAEVNDKQFCLVRLPEKPETATRSGKKYHELKIVSVNAIYTGGGIWNYMGELESGKFFMAFDDPYYEVMIFDADPRKAGEDGEDAYYPEWQEAHTLWDYNENDGIETEETLGMIRRIYNSLTWKEFCDKESHITALDNYEHQLRMEGKL